VGAEQQQAELGLSDAGAWLQHQPQAAYHVAALARRHAGLETPQDISAITARLPAMITTALLLNAARQGQSPQPANGAQAQREAVRESQPSE
jgi:hypothetical protein